MLTNQMKFHKTQNGNEWQRYGIIEEKQWKWTEQRRKFLMQIQFIHMKNCWLVRSANDRWFTAPVNRKHFKTFKFSNGQLSICHRTFHFTAIIYFEFSSSHDNFIVFAGYFCKRKEVDEKLACASVWIACTMREEDLAEIPTFQVKTHHVHSALKAKLLSKDYSEFDIKYMECICSFEIQCFCSARGMHCGHPKKCLTKKKSNGIW